MEIFERGSLFANLCYYAFVCYLYLLINGLEDPFDILDGDANFDLKPIDRFKQRLGSDFFG